VRDHIALVPDSRGVALVTAGVLRHLATRIYPAELDVLAFRTELFSNLPFIRRVYPITRDYSPTVEGLFETAILDREYHSALWNLDSQPHRQSSPQHLSQLVAEKLGFTIPPTRPLVVLTEAERATGGDAADRIRGGRRGAPLVYLGVTASTPNKQWPLARWRLLVKYFAGRCHFVAHKDCELEDVVRLDVGLRETLAILRECHACVTVDSFALHAASAEGVAVPSVIAILGSSHPHVVAYTDTVVFYRAGLGLDCQPCGRPYSLFDRSIDGRPWQCPHVACMDGVPVDAVIEALEVALSSTTPRDVVSV